jgi:hypothetical protein
MINGDADSPTFLFTPNQDRQAHRLTGSVIFTY